MENNLHSTGNNVLTVSQTTKEDLHSLEGCLEIDFLSISSPVARSESGRDVVSGLAQTPKSLPPRYFYDNRGSQLFEQICELPEYYLTRTEARILRENAGEIARRTGPCELVELGSGNSTKTRQLLDAYQGSAWDLRYVPIDVSSEILIASARQLLREYPALHVRGLVGTYERALAQLEPTSWPSRTIVFLGSTLGNLTPQESDRFFSRILGALDGGDYFLLGVDLQKPKQILEAAYNDARGVTARFNLNMLAHLNQRFEGNFDTQFFEHDAFYNERLNRIEMHLRCLRSHAVSLKALDLTVEFEAGETIMTEISRKFDLEEMRANLQTKGFKTLAVLTDPKRWFGLILSQKSCGH